MLEYLYEGNKQYAGQGMDLAYDYKNDYLDEDKQMALTASSTLRWVVAMGVVEEGADPRCVVSVDGGEGGGVVMVIGSKTLTRVPRGLGGQEGCS